MTHPHRFPLGIVSLFLLLLPFTAPGQVTQRDTTLLWDHFDYTLDEYYGISSWDASTIVTDTLAGIVLENEWLRITVVPELGARVVSMVYKPTGQEQLYTNPVGVPYLMGQGIFYHDWLMVYSGIFPTFPEPEHGKYWLVPWDWEMTAGDDGSITLSMWKQDTLFNPQRPGQYNNGTTGITCYFDVKLGVDEPFMGIDVRLENDAVADNYEYWTCITFAPGSEIGDTYTPSASEMVVPIETYQVGWNPGDWMNHTDAVVQTGGPRVQRFENLAHLSNWEEQGIAYAYPALEENYYGVINHTNETGLFRISSDQSTTPGMKFWTWGDSQGLNADPTDFGTWARPYIELWSGTSQEFFEDARLEANASISWTETYMPTVGIPGADYAEKGLIFHYDWEEEGYLRLYGFAPTLPEGFTVYVSLRQVGDYVWWADHDFVPTGASTDVVEFDWAEAGLDPGDYELEILLDIDGNRKAFFEEITLSEVLGLGDLAEVEMTLMQPSSGVLALAFAEVSLKTITLLTSTGRRVQQIRWDGQAAELRDISPGLYLLTVEGPTGYAVRQLRIW